MLKKILYTPITIDYYPKPDLKLKFRTLITAWVCVILSLILAVVLSILSSQNSIVTHGQSTYIRAPSNKIFFLNSNNNELNNFIWSRIKFPLIKNSDMSLFNGDLKLNGFGDIWINTIKSATFVGRIYARPFVSLNMINISLCLNASNNYVDMNGSTPAISYIGLIYKLCDDGFCCIDIHYYDSFVLIFELFKYKDNTITTSAILMSEQIEGEMITRNNFKINNVQLTNDDEIQIIESSDELQILNGVNKIMYQDLLRYKKCFNYINHALTDIDIYMKLNRINAIGYSIINPSMFDVTNQMSGNLDSSTIKNNSNKCWVLNQTIPTSSIAIDGIDNLIKNSNIKFDYIEVVKESPYNILSTFISSFIGAFSIMTTINVYFNHLNV